MRPEAEPWWRQAEADLRNAERASQERQFYLVSWLAQQAAEKGLKALYFEQHGRMPSRTHALEFLGSEVGAPASVEADLITLAPAFDIARYPDATGRAPVDAITAGLAESHLSAARRIRTWIAGEL